MSNTIPAGHFAAWYANAEAATDEHLAERVASMTREITRLERLGIHTEESAIYRDELIEELSVIHAERTRRARA